MGLWRSLGHLEVIGSFFLTSFGFIYNVTPLHFKFALMMFTCVDLCINNNILLTSKLSFGQKYFVFNLFQYIPGTYYLSLYIAL